MVQPEDYIMIVAAEFRSCHRDGFVGVVGEDGQRAGGIEANAANRRGIDVILGYRSFDRVADTSPNV